VSFFDKVKKGAVDAATKAKEGVEELQTKNEIVKTYEQIGRKAYDLREHNELENAELEPMFEHIAKLKAKLEAAERAEWEEKEKTGDEAPASDQPPATPS
jgi:hypothetical protein